MAAKSFDTVVVQWKSPDTPKAVGLKVLGAGPTNQVTVNGQTATFTVDANNVSINCSLRPPNRNFL